VAIEQLHFTGADGQAVTAANSGFAFFVATNGGTLTFDGSWRPRESSVSIRSASGATLGSLYGSFTFSAASNVLAYDVPVKPVSLPPTWRDSFLRVDAGSGRGFEVQVSTAGELVIVNASNAVAWTSAAGVFEVGRGVIVSVYATRSSTGTLRAVVYEEDGVTVRADSGALTVNTGAAAFSLFRYGTTSAQSNRPYTMLMGEPRWDRAASGLLAAPAPAVHRPFKMWIGGEYVPVLLRRWGGSGYQLLG